MIPEQAALTSGILAFGFGNLALLGWMAAAAAPILIHLWMRHTHRDMPWAAMEFLREAIKRNARRLKLQQWLLLSIRTLLIVLLVLAAAKPYLSGWNVLTGGPRVHRIIVLDTSLSMQYEVEGESLFRRSQQLAQEMIEAARPGEVFSLITMADPPQVVVGKPIVDAGGVTREMENLQPTSRGASLVDTLKAIETVVAEARRQQRDLARHEVVFFTDLAAADWQTATSDGGSELAGVSRLLESLATEASLLVVDVGESDAQNLALSDLQVVDTVATTAEAIRLEATVTNHADRVAENVVVQLVADGREIDEQTLTLAARQSSTVVFEALIEQAAWHSLAVRMGEDALPPDDQHHLALDVKERMRVLAVEGEPQAARYVARALNPSGAATSPLEVVVVPEGALAEMPLEDYACVFLCNVARFTPRESEVLSQFVARGGGLVFFLGDRILPDDYNQSLAGEGAPRLTITPVVLQTGDQTPTGDEPPSLLPAEIGELVTTTTDTFGIDPLDYQHPIVAAFQGRERAGLLSTPVSNYFRLAPRGQAATALATLAGDPLLVTRPYGEGMVALVATAATLDTVDPATGQPWTLLPAWPSFLPIVRELVAYTAAHAQGQYEVIVGEPISGQLAASWATPQVAVVRPDGRSDLVPVVRDGGDPAWSYVSTDEPGIYQVRSEGGSEAIALAAVNVDTRESDLSRVPPDTLHEALVVRRVAPTDTATVEGMTHDAPLHRWLLYGVLVLLLTESVLAWAFGGRGA